MKRFALLCLALLCLTIGSWAQTPSPTPPSVDEDNDVVKISTNLIQIDVSVTDSKGRPVTDLRPDEIEIFENGKKQDITNFSFVNSAARTVESRVQKSPKDKSATATVYDPPVALKEGQVRRTIALVVDDFNLSFQSTSYVRSALKKFVDEQMQPNDLVAIIRTGSGIGALQQFTSDKRMLHAAIEKVKWKPLGGDILAFAPMRPEDLNFSKKGLDGRVERVYLEPGEQLRDDVFAAGSLGAINYVVKGLQTLPGRKSIILFTDGMPLQIHEFDGTINSRIDNFNMLIEVANRASVVIYAVDPRGLLYTGLTAADNTMNLSFLEVKARTEQKGKELYNSQEGLRYLSDRTGGRAWINNNDLSLGVEKALDDQSGFYLVGYQPDDGTFDPVKRRFNKLTVKVTRPGTDVRYRSGFFNIKDEEPKAVPQTPQQQIFSALSSPFSSGQIALKMTPILYLNEKKEAFISSFVHVKATDIKFIDEADGWKKITFDVVIVAFGDNGQVIDQLARTETVRTRDTAFDTLLKDGFIYMVKFPIKKAGGYQVRIALRDTETSNIGSANQFVEVPNINKAGTILSGIVLRESGNEKKTDAASARQDAALRQFKLGTTISYHLSAYSDPVAAGAARYTTQMRLFYNGKVVYEGKTGEAGLRDKANPIETILGGEFQLGTKMETGDYVLQVILTDTSAKKGKQIKTQWIDFEVIP